MKQRRKGPLALVVETLLVVLTVALLLAAFGKLAPVAPGLVAVLRGLLRPLVLVPVLIALVAFRLARQRRRSSDDQRPN